MPLLKEAIDWADQAERRFGEPVQQQARSESDRGRWATPAAAASPCSSPTEDSRVNGLGIWFSGAGLAGARGNDACVAAEDQGARSCSSPATSKHDIAYANGKSTFEAITHTPIFYGWQDDLQHIGTFGAKNGGDNGRDRRQLARVDDAQRSERGPDVQRGQLHVCKDPTWHIQKKKIDDRPSSRAR